jgi:hypothetical protein
MPLPSFAAGANLPWLSYGGDFGANAWRPGGGCAHPDARERLRKQLEALAASGATVVRWFVYCDGRAGLIHAPDGGAAGLDDRVIPDMDAAVEELDRAGLRAIFVLFDFHWFHRARIVNGVQLGGRRAWLADARLRARTFEHVLAPLLDRYGRAPVIAAWDIINEPEWITRCGRAASRLRPVVARAVERAGVSRKAMRTIIGEACRLIHDRTTQAVTVGSASASSLDLVCGLGIDLYQVHWYDRYEMRSPLSQPVSDLALDRPVLLGEFPTRGSACPPDEILTAARKAGYAGALGWSVLSDDEATDRPALLQALAGAGFSQRRVASG